MTYAIILTALCGDSNDRKTLKAAVDIARRHNAIVKVLVAYPQIAASVWGEAFGGLAIGGDALTAIQQTNDDIRHRVETMVEAVAQSEVFEVGPGPGGRRIIMATTAPTPWLSLIHEMPLVDLLVLSDDVAKGEGFWTGIPADAVISGKIPVFIPRGEVSPIGSTIAIAWDASAAAGRAVRAALPMLEAASEVVVLQDRDGMNAMEKDAGDPDALVQYLKLHGVKAVRSHMVDGRHEGRQLLDAARNAGAAILVAGAYGHPRLGELLFGGATRAFIDAEGPPSMFLAH